MRVDPLVPRAAKLEATDGDKVRVDSTSLDNPLVALADQAVKAAALQKQIDVLPDARSAEFLNIDSWAFPMLVTDR
jgi:hypothetical protein